VFYSLDKFSEWLSSRSPRKKNFLLSQSNIYIFPSTYGFSFLALLLLMLLTAINYQNSLIYLLTFLLGTMFFLSIWFCFLNLSGLKVEAIEPGRCYEGEPAHFNYRISRDKGLPIALKVGLEKASVEPIPFTLQKCEDLVLITTKKPRGRHRINRLYIESRFPFGLVVAWTWLKLDAECWVYPEPLFSLPDSSSIDSADNESKFISKDDLNDLRSYQQGDTSTRILWKKFAAKDELIVRDFDSGSYSPEWVDWNNYSDPTEKRLKHLCFDVCQLSEGARTYGFSIPGVKIEPAFGALHKQKCLDALALFEQ
jgi:uncharacterized protein (DUF58 family)